MDSKYTIAKGPDGLREALNALSPGKEHFILYQLNQQQSLIKIDNSEQPYQLWYYDLMGRPATMAVKNAVSQFLQEKCGTAATDNSRFVDLVDSKARLDASLGKVTQIRPDDPLQQGLNVLSACKRQPNLRGFGFFTQKPEPISQKPEATSQETEVNKINSTQKPPTT